MDLLALHPSDELYGADRVLLTLVRSWNDEFDVQVVLPTDVDYPERLLSGRLEQAGVSVIRADVPVLRRAYLRVGALPRLLSRVWVAIGLLRRLRPRLVYLSTSAMLLVAPVARLLGVMPVAHLHEVWSRADRVLLAPLIACCPTVVVVSEPVAASLGRARRRAIVVHNGFDIPQVDSAVRARLRGRLGVGDDDLLAIVASRWNAWKGHTGLLAAWAGLRRTDLHLAVLGGPPAIGASVDVPTLVAGLADPTRVHLVGETSQALDWVAAADVVLVPSSRPDPLPTIAIEAAALGRAVLASACGGLPEIVVDGATGRLLPPDDPQAWRQALDGLERTSLEGWGRAAAERFSTEFTVDRFLSTMREVVVTGLDRAGPDAAGPRGDRRGRGSGVE